MVHAPIDDVADHKQCSQRKDDHDGGDGDPARSSWIERRATHERILVDTLSICQQYVSIMTHRVYLQSAKALESHD